MSAALCVARARQKAKAPQRAPELESALKRLSKARAALSRAGSSLSLIRIEMRALREQTDATRARLREVSELKIERAKAGLDPLAPIEFRITLSPEMMRGWETHGHHAEVCRQLADIFRQEISQKHNIDRAVRHLGLPGR